MTGRRVHERFVCDLPLTLVFEDREHSARAANISLGGMYVLTDMDVPYGANIRVRFRVPALKEDAEVDTTCRWVKPDGIGLQFGSLRALEVWALNQYFKELSSASE